MARFRSLPLAAVRKTPKEGVLRTGGKRPCRQMPNAGQLCFGGQKGCAGYMSGVEGEGMDFGSCVSVV